MKNEYHRIFPDELKVISEWIVGVKPLLAEADYFCLRGVTYAICDSGKPLLVGGVYPLWPGVGEAWVLRRGDAPTIPLFTMRTFRRVMREAIETMKLHRLQIDFSVTDHAGFGISKSLGFEPEGLMRKYTYDQQDRMRMAIIVGGVSCL